MLVILILLVSSAFAGTISSHFQLSGECATLRTELEGTDNSTVKLAAFNDFLTTLGIQDKFYAILDDAYTATSSLSADAKTAVQDLITEFKEGALFLPKDQLKIKVKAVLGTVSDTEKTAIRDFGKTYGQEIRDLVTPVLPSSCKASADTSDVILASGFA